MNENALIIFVSSVAINEKRVTHIKITEIEANLETSRPSYYLSIEPVIY